MKVAEIQRFCMHDGPGIRTTVFLKGCPLRCAWCHNPETQKSVPEVLFYSNKCIMCGRCVTACASSAHSIDENHKIDRQKCISCFDCIPGCPTGAVSKCGEDMTAREIIEIALRDSAFYCDRGGITLSGGEPFSAGEEIIELLKLCKAHGLSTVVETCGYANTDLLLKSAEFVDLFLWDIKDTDSARHKEYTGVSNELILDNLVALNEAEAKIRLRCILVNGVNTNPEHYSRLADIAKKIINLDGIEFIPYHVYGGTKSVFLGYSDSGKSEWIPTDEQLIEAKSILRTAGIKVV